VRSAAFLRCAKALWLRACTARIAVRSLEQAALALDLGGRSRGCSTVRSARELIVLFDVNRASDIRTVVEIANSTVCAR
jgi:hypothetical protein